MYHKKGKKHIKWRKKETHNKINKALLQELKQWLKSLTISGTGM